MAEKSKISMLLSDKPAIAPVAPSALFSRLKDFLPQMEVANRTLPSSSSGNCDDFVIENVVESSSSDDDSSDDESEKIEEETTKEKAGADHIEIDVDVFREENSKVDDRDVSVQEVEQLPDAFRMENGKEKVENRTTPKGKLIEEI